MAGYNYKYFGFAAFKEQATLQLAEEIKSGIESKLSAMNSSVSFEIIEDFLYFTLSSIETVYYDLMEATFDYFIDKLKGNGAQVVGYCQNYSATHNDVPFYDDLDFKEFGEISDYQYSELKQIMVKEMTQKVAYDAVLECQWRGYAENYEEDILFNYLAAIFRLEEESILYLELYHEYFEKIVVLLIESLEYVDYTLALDEDTIVNEILEVLRKKSSDKIEEYMETLFDEVDRLFKMYNELLQYYGTAKNEEILDTIDHLSASELKVLYQNTYDHV